MWMNKQEFTRWIHSLSRIGFALGCAFHFSYCTERVESQDPTLGRFLAITWDREDGSGRVARFSLEYPWNLIGEPIEVDPGSILHIIILSLAVSQPFPP